MKKYALYETSELNGHEREWRVSWDDLFRLFNVNRRNLSKDRLSRHVDALPFKQAKREYGLFLESCPTLSLKKVEE